MAEAVYKIQSVRTQHFLLSLTILGKRVETSDGDDFGHSNFTISPPVSPAVATSCTIRGEDGMFISPGHSKKDIVWDGRRHLWWIVPTLVPGEYEIYHPNAGHGQDLYWYQNHHEEPFVGLAPGHGIPQAIFRLT
ncbi:hypothetical protein F5887DRAFT_912529 [Amanita rubescens]|nr:hypothetical protein F5887DRAFT_1084530 [Amanita rubescens]KAF8351881.1 hypothetical protein F5887DRAFT_912529 [Amanita rubescens]